MEKCSVGLHLQEDCHQGVLGVQSEERNHSISELSDNNQELIKLRSKFSDVQTVCDYHLKTFISIFEHRQRVCCDPFKKHGTEKTVRKSLKPVTLSFSKKHKNVDLVPGTKLCISCRKLVISDAKANNEDNSDSDYQPDKSFFQDKLNDSCNLIGCSPVKVTKRKFRERSAYLKHKTQRMAETFTELATKAFGIDNPPSTSSNSEEIDKLKCNDCFHLMEKLREKFKRSTVHEKVQILTLALTGSWSIKEIVSYFQTTEYMVKKARKMLQEGGVLSKSYKRKGHALCEETVSKVKDFYYDDEISRISANKKDCVSVPSEQGKRELKTKRLILHNLKDVYLQFKEKNPNEKIGFTKFCELRPKECVTVNNRGIHSVCVCTYHQNVKLMLQSIPLNIPYQELLLKLVCSLESEECMLHRCANCPQDSTLHDFLMQLEALETKDTIAFKQWIHTDRSTLETLVKSVDEFIEILVGKLKTLSHHHFIAKAQSQHLKDTKVNLNDDSCVILADFAENYTCVLQDAAQGFHWQNIQATVHPFVIYYKFSNELKSMSLCFISDCLKHDTTTFYTFQKTALQYICKELPHLKHVVYFSDGSAAQYKNYKNFMNLCFHKEDHGTTAEWNFFATSHGKNACDGVGGAVKRLATRASLQRLVNDLILSPEDLYKFASENIKGIKIFYTTAADIESNQKFLEERYALVSTIPGTRENHYFVPTGKSTLLVKRFSLSQNSFKAFLGSKNTEDVLEIVPEKFFAVIYGKKWWLGKVLECSTVERDAKVHFMHPCGPSSTYFWPVPSDICWVPFENIIKEVPVPASSSSSGRTYRLEDHINKAIEGLVSMNDLIT